MGEIKMRNWLCGVGLQRRRWRKSGKMGNKDYKNYNILGVGELDLEWENLRRLWSLSRRKHVYKKKKKVGRNYCGFKENV